MSRRPPLFRATDLARALRAGAMAGVSVRVAITKDGALTVSPMPAETPKPAPDVKPKDAQPGGQARSRAVN
jgi:hypothetical protein